MSNSYLLLKQQQTNKPNKNGGIESQVGGGGPYDSLYFVIRISVSEYLVFLIIPVLVVIETSFPISFPVYETSNTWFHKQETIIIS